MTSRMCTMPTGSSGMAASAPDPVQIVRSDWRQIGIGHTEARQDGAFEIFHGCGGGFGIVVVAEQVEKSVYREMRDVIIEPLAFGLGFARGRLIGDCDVPARCHPVRW